MDLTNFFDNPWNGIIVGLIALVLCWGPRNVWDAFHNSEETQERSTQ